VWGTTVLAVRHLSTGQSLELGEVENALLPKPDGLPISDRPVRAAGAGWELDATGATNGVVYLRGRTENPSDLSRSGAPMPIVAGDHGLIQYGSLSIFFQFVPAPPPIQSKQRIDWVFVLAFLFALVSIGGGLALIGILTTPRSLDKPTELTSADALAVQFHLEETPPPTTGEKKSDDGGSGVKDPGAKDTKKQGGGKKAKGAEGALGRNGDKDHTEQTGPVKQALGGMSDVLSSDVGHEIQKTLGSISSVAEALGGLNSDKIVLGKSGGLGMRGSGSGGGGDTEGVPFGSGTMETGWGPGKGGGFGSGAGGPGGRGRGGNGRGGNGTGDGTGDGSGSGSGTSERKVAGADAPQPGHGLTPAQIQRVVMSRYGAFRACYEAASAREPSLSGGVTVSFGITPGGDVSASRVQSSTLGNARVEGCILRQFQRLRFPTADKPTNAAFPFIFKPGKK
jgi:hypothetical protein